MAEGHGAISRAFGQSMKPDLYRKASGPGLWELADLEQGDAGSHGSSTLVQCSFPDPVFVPEKCPISGAMHFLTTNVDTCFIKHV
ncbi:hypothetical protein TNCT_369041 [Trichonephila clavata]|uniref:Uncharacterized protein n=1 Tax=Trichonephila clavata TaxID=2740835 RepID=A0A8X6JBV3_TRICU|nr:hypothetical protein TNCT_369041 [Trichonephila clavata]